MIFMKVKCISGENSFLNEKRESTYEFLEIGAIYTVYGMIINHGVLCYYICDRARDLFPIARPMHFFEIIDNRLSRFWVFGIIEAFENYPVWMFSEWINEPYFQDNITDYEEREVAIFKSYKESMDLEFSDPSIQETAQIGDDKWLICPMCLDTWQSVNYDGALVRCSNCQAILNNPRHLK